MKKPIVNLIIIIYVLLAIVVTICLLTYNDYKISEFGGNSFIIINENDDSFDYKKGDLVIVGKENLERANPGDVLFFYKDDGVKIAEIQKKQDFGDAGIIFTIDGNYQVVQEDFIGTSLDQKVIGKVGGILSLLESKWGFLFLIVFPSLLAFLHQVSELISELTSKK